MLTTASKKTTSRSEAADLEEIALVDLTGLLFNDCETFNAIHDLRQVGSQVYARNAEVIVLTWALEDEPAQLWSVREGPMPAELRDLIKTHRMKVAHNAFFEQNVYAATGLCKWDPSRWHCTMAQAYAHSMPGALEQLCRFLDVPQEQRKKGEGQRLISMFCKPDRHGRRITHVEAPEAWAAFEHYGLHDTIALREVYKRMPQLNLRPGEATGHRAIERALWELDQKVNRKGFAIDVPMAKAAVKVLAGEKKEFDRKVSELTQDRITSATQRGRVLEQLQEWGLGVKNLQAATITSALDDEEVQGEIRALLDARRAVGKASNGKYKKVLSMVSEDGRLRGGLQFAGAKRTGRWAGRGFQPHNLPRPTRHFEEIEEGIELLKAGALDLVETDIHGFCSDALRSLIVAPEGKELRVADWNAIEGRILAWLANEEWKLERYRDPDADMYVATYNKIYNRPLDSPISKDDRQQGKVFELSFGYEGGVNAELASAKTYGVDPVKLGDSAWRGAPRKVRDQAIRNHAFMLDIGADLPKISRKLWIQLEAVKLMWRGMAKNTVRLWKLYEGAAERALKSPGVKFQAGKCVFMYRGQFLYCRLPSGRFLLYRQPKLSKGKLTYAADYGGRTGMYGGKWAENIVQAIARDIMGHGMLEADKKGYNIILTVHDEIITEEGQGDASTSLSKLLDIMGEPPAWAEGLPLKAAGYEAVRYRKD